MLTTGKGEVVVRGLGKSFTIDGRPLAVLSGLDLTVRSGECVVIVGASGSGKTTLLRVLAGLETADEGTVLVDGRPIDGVGPERAVIFQEPRLLPWLTVKGNVAFGLEARGVDRREAEERADEALALVGLLDFAQAMPVQLSGGMAQRVGVARALAVRPEILLLDEPFGALDAMTRIVMQEELVRLWREEGFTVVLVTHDLEEAVILADRILVLPKARGKAPREIGIDLPRPRDRNSRSVAVVREELMREFGLDARQQQ